MPQFPPPILLSDSQDEEAQRLLDSLDHWSERCEGHYMPKRTQFRTIYRQKVAVFVPEGYKIFADKEVGYSFEAWARNLSSGGISLLFPGQIKFERGIVCLNPTQERKRCVYMSVKRVRRVSQEFWEYGLQFEGMLDEEHNLQMESSCSDDLPEQLVSQDDPATIAD